MSVTLFTENSLSISVRDEGKGPAVVVLSGWGYGSLMGEAALGTLRDKGYRVITVDVPGTGALKDRSSFVHIPRLSKLVASYLRQNGAREATVVGHSFGSMIAQEMAMTEDDVVGKLVLVSALPGIGGILPDLNTALEMLNRLMAGGEGLLSFLFTPTHLGNLRKTLGTVFDELEKPTSSAALSGQVWAASRWTNFGRLHRMYQPTLVIHGAKDPLSPLAHVKNFAGQLPHAQLLVFENCGYLPFFESKDASLKAILGFLR
jgi:non-heme chloroperoxidase